MPTGVPSPLKFPPGVLKVDSLLASIGRYTDADKIRFVKGFAETIGGWQVWNDTPVPGVTRAMLSWQDVDGNIYIVCGSTERLYCYTASDDPPLDITPLQESGTLATDPFAVVNGDATVTVTDTAHGLSVGQVVIFSGATAGGGITINGEYVVATVVNANSYTIEHTSNATSTDSTTGGAAVAFEYLIAPGNVDAQSSEGGGWGEGAWGEGPWGGTDGGAAAVRHWSLDLWGTTLLASFNGGTLYDWDPSPSSPDRAEEVLNAPSSMRGMFVTESRFVMTYGTSDPMTLQWQDQNTLTEWTPTTTNTASSRRIQGGTYIVAGCPVQSLGNMIWTDTSAFLVTYTGSKFVFDSQLAGKNCGLVGPKAFCLVNAVPHWMGKSAFHRYVGYVEDIPRQEEIWDWFAGELNDEQASKVCCHYNPSFGEVMWFWPSGSSDEPSRYLLLSMEDNSWTPGTLDRTATTVPFYDVRPFMTDEAGYVYRHESGTLAVEDAIEWELQAAPIEIEDGQQYLDINGYIPDFQRVAGVVAIQLDCYDRITGVEAFDVPIETQTRYFNADAPERVVDFKANGRSVAVKLSSDVPGSAMRLGIAKLDVRPRGKRR